MRTKLIGCAQFLILALVMQVNLLGQVVTGTLLGTVLDSTGAVVPNASVTITNEGTGVSDKMTTTAQGFYTFATLTPGQYNLSVEMPDSKRRFRGATSCSSSSRLASISPFHPAKSTSR